VDSAGKTVNFKWAFWKDLDKVTHQGREYAKIGDRMYTKHAEERMIPKRLGEAAGKAGVDGRGIPPMVVEYTLKYGSKISESAVNGVKRTIWQSEVVQVVAENSNKIIVTVMRKGK
jgi:hypothetical protein